MPLPILPLRLTPKNPLILHHNPIIIRVKKATNIQLTIKIETNIGTSMDVNENENIGTDKYSIKNRDE